jgi:hypothetical protein
MSGEDAPEAGPIRIIESLHDWMRTQGYAEAFERLGYVELDGYLLLIQFPGLLPLISGCPDAGECLGTLNAVNRLFDRSLESLQPCQLSRMGDEYIFLTQADADAVNAALRGLYRASSRDDMAETGIPGLSPRLSCARQRIRLLRLQGRSEPGVVASSLDYLRSMIVEGRSCRASLVFGERVVRELGDTSSLRLIGLRSAEGAPEVLGMYEDLYPFPDHEADILRRNTPVTDRGISAFHAGLLSESRELFFRALESAPFDPLPGRYLNLIQRHSMS